MGHCVVKKTDGLILRYFTFQLMPSLAVAALARLAVAALVNSVFINVQANMEGWAR